VHSWYADGYKVNGLVCNCICGYIISDFIGSGAACLSEWSDVDKCGEGELVVFSVKWYEHQEPNRRETMLAYYCGNRLPERYQPNPETHKWNRRESYEFD
jgi:hypothetical protein